MNTSYASTFTQHLDSLLSESIIFLFHNSSRCSAVITITLLFLQLLVSWGQRGNDGLCGGFLETEVGRIQGPFELEFIPVSARGFALFRQQDIGHLRKGLDLYNKCISVVKMRLKLHQVGFWNDQKSSNVVMWKDKEYEYISSSWNKQH